MENSQEQNIEKFIESTKELGKIINVALESKDFTIHFGKKSDRRTLHIQYEDLPKVADLTVTLYAGVGFKSRQPSTCTTVE